MVHDRAESADPDFPLSDFRMAVFARSAPVERIVDMDRFEPIDADYAVEFSENSVEVAGNVIPSVPDMAGVETYTERMIDPVDDLAQLFETTADFRSLAGHRLKQNRRGKISAERGNDPVEHIGYESDPRFNPLPDMAAGMEIVKRPGSRLKPLQVVGHHRTGEIQHPRFGTGGVERIGSVGQNGTDAVFRGKSGECRDIGLVERFGGAAAGIAGEELKYVRAYRPRRLSHGEISAGRTQMATYFHHNRPSILTLGSSAAYTRSVARLTN